MPLLRGDPSSLGSQSWLGPRRKESFLRGIDLGLVDARSRSDGGCGWASPLPTGLEALLLTLTMFVQSLLGSGHSWCAEPNTGAECCTPLCGAVCYGLESRPPIDARQPWH